MLLELIKEGTLPFKERDVREAIEEWKADGFPACHHSEEFRNAYFPAYRVIKKEYALFLSLFVKIDNMLQRGSVNLAIEGGCASGKSTLGKLLKQVYDCTVFHMDDFFLQPKQRTRERLEEPGGNVDRERFLQEVLSPLSQNIPIEYRSFDCHTLTLQPSIMLFPKKLNVVEGVYCMHPELEQYYNLSVFLDITPKQQKERIRKRNSKELAERFFNEWIPMEQRYFEAMDVKKRCDINIEIGTLQ